MCILMLMFLIVQQVVDAFVVYEGVTYFYSFWNWVEMVNLALFAAMAVWWCIYVSWEKEEFKRVSLGMYSARPNLNFLAEQYTYACNLASLNIVFSYCKLFKHLQVFPAFGLLWRTAARSLLDVGPFLIVFAMLVVAFTCGAHFTFGSYLADFHSWLASLSTLLQALLSGLPYSQMAAFMPMSAALFTVAWVVVVAFVLMSTFAAIMIEWYLQTSEENKTVQKKLAQCVGVVANEDIFHTLWLRLRGRLTGTHLASPGQELLDKEKQVSTALHAGRWANSEEVRKALLKGKDLTAGELARHFKGNVDAAYDFAKTLAEAVGTDADAPAKSSEVDEVDQLYHLCRSVERLDMCVTTTRMALHQNLLMPRSQTDSL